MNVRGVSSAALLAMALVGAVAAPIAASAAPVARAGAAIGASEQQVTGGNAIAWAMAALIAGFTAYLILSDDDDEDEPTSP